MWQQPGLTFKKVTDFSDQSLELVYIPLCKARCGLVNTRFKKQTKKPTINEE